MQRYNGMAGKQMDKQKEDLFLGDYVKWESSNGQAYGKIVKRVTDGSLTIPQTDYVLEGTEDNPAYLIMQYQCDKDGNYTETANAFGLRHMSLSRSPSPEHMKEIAIEIENEESEEDQELIEMFDTYEQDRMKQEQMAEMEEMCNCLGKGDYVRFEVADASYRGRVVDVATEGELMSSAGFKLEGLKDDPAVLIRLYREMPDGTLEETDMKVVHRLSSLIKIPSLTYNHLPKTEKSIVVGQRESKVFAFNIQETKEIEIDGEKYGLVRGYASTYGNIDRGNDRVIPGAFAKSLKRYMETKRPIKMYFNHNSNEIIGGFPIEKIKDDGNGLYVEGQVNLAVQKGREAYALAKQGVMQDFSIGYTVEDFDMKTGGIRELKQLELWEISMVGEPMNTEARILTVKSNNIPYQDLPLAAEDYEWNREEAIQRVKSFTGSSDTPSDTYRNAFMCFDASSPENFTAYQLPYADVVNGKLMAIPKAIFDITATIKGNKATEISALDQSNIIDNINRYYTKMDKDSPLKANAKQYHYDDVISLKDKRDLEKLLRDSGAFSRKAATYLSSLLQVKQSDSVEEIEVNEIKDLLNYLKNRG